jgi:hypothetical protein
MTLRKTWKRGFIDMGIMVCDECERVVDYDVEPIYSEFDNGTRWLCKECWDEMDGD